ncbi:MAG TPA: hypothetical protein VN655_05890 [Pseudolabrys sp.]|nr:hypothetical protein [Pseudolabrys sp.]
MRTDTATDRMQRELDRAMAALRADLDRVELLTAALSAFNRPVPDYEPSFHHARRFGLAAHEMGQPARD